MEILMNKITTARIATQEEIKGITSWPAHLIGDEHPSIDDNWETEFLILKIGKEFLFSLSLSLKDMGYESKQELDKIYIFPENQNLMLIPFEPIAMFIMWHLLKERPDLFSRYEYINLGYDYDSLTINGEEIQISKEEVGGFIHCFEIAHILL